MILFVCTDCVLFAEKPCGVMDSSYRRIMEQHISFICNWNALCLLIIILLHTDMKAKRPRNLPVAALYRQNSRCLQAPWIWGILWFLTVADKLEVGLDYSCNWKINHYFAQTAITSMQRSKSPPECKRPRYTASISKKLFRFNPDSRRSKAAMTTLSKAKSKKITRRNCLAAAKANQRKQTAAKARKVCCDLRSGPHVEYAVCFYITQNMSKILRRLQLLNSASNKNHVSRTISAFVNLR